jgi:hypothetical protein
MNRLGSLRAAAKESRRRKTRHDTPQNKGEKNPRSRRGFICQYEFRRYACQADGGT